MEYDLSTVEVPPPEKMTEEGVEAIHDVSIQIMEDIGIKVAHEEARDILAEAGATVDEENEIVRIPESLVDDALEKPPSSFTLHSRNPDRNTGVGDGDTTLTSTYGAPNVLRYGEGRRASTIADYEDLAKIAQMEEVIGCTGYNLCEPTDVPQEVKHYEMVPRSLKLTDKPVMGSTYGEERARASLEMVGIANDDRDLSKPYMTGIINTVSPRTWDTRMTGGLLEYAKAGQPVLISPAVMANASGPSTLAGSFALANAEILTGVVLSQQINPGTPIVYGLPSSNVDVRYGSFSIGSPEGGLFVSFAAQMARSYDIPVRAGGTLNDSKTIDDQSGAESMFQLMIAMFSDIDFMLHAAGILNSYSTVSPEKYVLDCERIRYVQRFQRGYDLNDETFAVDLLEEVEPGGHFLNKRHTLEHSKTDHYMTKIFNRQSYDDWESKGSKDAFAAAHDRVNELLDTYERPPLDEDIEQELDEYVERGKEEALN
ncbi:trimethylamine methyltransferase family protein [Haloarculaceae archaeon H-GB1-1]|nr:trimethylamine methyltransferase family protein [Haloarculaceae archaeon H-GB1-1]